MTIYEQTYIKYLLNVSMEWEELEGLDLRVFLVAKEEHCHRRAYSVSLELAAHLLVPVVVHVHRQLELPWILMNPVAEVRFSWVLQG